MKKKLFKNSPQSQLSIFIEVGTREFAIIFDGILTDFKVIIENNTGSKGWATTKGATFNIYSLLPYCETKHRLQQEKN